MSEFDEYSFCLLTDANHPFTETSSSLPVTRRAVTQAARHGELSLRQHNHGEYSDSDSGNVGMCMMWTVLRGVDRRSKQTIRQDDAEVLNCFGPNFLVRLRNLTT